MDSFTESILTRARERQKILKNFDVDEKMEVSPFKTSREEIVTSTVLKPNSSNNGNVVLAKRTNQNSTQNSSVKNLQSPKRIYEGTLSGSPKTNTVNIQEANLNMEIKVTSSDNITVQVEVARESSEQDNVEEKDFGLRKGAKDRLNRLGRLYGGDDAAVPSPIHRSEKICLPVTTEKKIFGKGLKRLANLAQEINHWEDDIKPKNKAEEMQELPTSETTTLSQCNNLSTMELEGNQANRNVSPKKLIFGKQKEYTETKPVQGVMKLDKSVLDTLESQGFQRVSVLREGKLTYDFADREIDKKESSGKNVNSRKNEWKENQSPSKKIYPKDPIKCLTKTSVVDKAARFESANTKNGSQDPSLLSISEKKALFEKNSDEPLIPRAPFGTSIACTDRKLVHKLGKPVKMFEPRTVLKNTERSELLEINSSDDLKSSESIFSVRCSEHTDKKENQLISKLEPFEIKTSPVLQNIPEEEQDEIEKMDNIENDKMNRVPMSNIRPEEKISPCHKKSNLRHSVSPKVAAVLKDVKKVKVSPAKPGQLYPNLSDVETETEDQTEYVTPNSSMESNSRDDMNTSFGREIMDAVCRNRTPQKRYSCSETASDISDILDDMDDYLNESLVCDDENKSLGPTPPKQACKQDNTRPSHSFNYKSFSPSLSDNFKSPMALNAGNPEKCVDTLHVVDGEKMLPLTHTVSFYRKQTTNTPVKSPTKRVIHSAEIYPKEDNSAKILVKIKNLQDEVNKQQLIIAQTSQALNLCNSTLEFMGSTEQVEAEKVLLLATQRRQALLNEIQRLKVEGTFRPLSRHAKDLPLEKGTLTISNISLPLKKEYVRALAAAGGKGHHVTCLVKCGEQVVSSKLVSTVASDIKNPCYELSIPGALILNDIYSDFAITLEVYCLQAQEEILPHDVKYHIKKDTKLTPKKSRQNSLLSRPIKESPGGPLAVRTTSFALMGYVVLSIQQMNKKTWKLNNTPSMSPLEGSVEMNVSCILTASVEYRGFLTMFGDISGFGAWHRRWFVLKENALSYWKYPDDEKKSPAIDCIDLTNCINEEVGPVSREICARIHTFLLETVRKPFPQDKDSLITICKKDKTIIRHLLSADTKEERILWCSKLNSALTAVKLWGTRIHT